MLHNKSLTALAKLISGSAFAIFFAIDSKEYLALIGALLCGLGSMQFIINQSGVPHAA